MLLLLLMFVPACSNSPTTPTGLACGEERWAVKTLSDVDATRVDLANVIVTSVSALNDLEQHWFQSAFNNQRASTGTP